MASSRTPSPSASSDPATKWRPSSSASASPSASASRASGLSGDAIAGHDRGPVGEDLGQPLADLGGVEADRDDRVRAEQPRVGDHPVQRVAAAVLEQLG